VYIGFAVADGHWLVIAIETNVAAIFIIVAAAAITQSPWLLVIGLAGHGSKISGSTPSAVCLHGGEPRTAPRATSRWKGSRPLSRGEL
jgi:hypothetical protein